MSGSMDKLMLGLHDGDGNEYWDYFVINNNGNVGIGTSDPGNYKLAVEGKIGCRELKINQDSWADYVFKKEYTLKTLDEIECHINEKGYLPGMPSEAEVKENGGVEVGAMQVKLLEKIEEMTLHMIAMKKENEKLQKRVNELEKFVSSK